MDAACRTASHNRADRLTIAALCGTVQRWAGHILRGNLDYPAEAIAELHTISTDPHLIAHAALETRHWQHSTIEALLLLAGAGAKDMAEIVAQLDAKAR